MRERQQLYGIFDLDTEELVTMDDWDGEEDTTISQELVTGYNRLELQKLIDEQGQIGFWEVRPIIY
jgi:hypothetical protein